jgi:hypothetical protein
VVAAKCVRETRQARVVLRDRSMDPEWEPGRKGP